MLIRLNDRKAISEFMDFVSSTEIDYNIINDEPYLIKIDPYSNFKKEIKKTGDGILIRIEFTDITDTTYTFRLINGSWRLCADLYETIIFGKTKDVVESWEDVKLLLSEFGVVIYDEDEDYNL